MTRARTITLWWMLGGVAALVLAACGSGSTTDRVTTSSPPVTQAAAPASTTVGSAAPATTIGATTNPPTPTPPAEFTMRPAQISADSYGHHLTWSGVCTEVPWGFAVTAGVDFELDGDGEAHNLLPTADDWVTLKLGTRAHPFAPGSTVRYSIPFSNLDTSEDYARAVRDDLVAYGSSGSRGFGGGTNGYDFTITFDAAGGTMQASGTGGFAVTWTCAGGTPATTVPPSATSDCTFDTPTGGTITVLSDVGAGCDYAVSVAYRWFAVQEAKYSDPFDVDVDMWRCLPIDTSDAIVAECEFISGGTPPVTKFQVRLEYMYG